MHKCRSDDNLWECVCVCTCVCISVWYMCMYATCRSEDSCGNQISPSAVFCYVGSEHLTQRSSCVAPSAFTHSHLASHGHVYRRRCPNCETRESPYNSNISGDRFIIYLTMYETRVNDEVNQTKFSSSFSQY